MKRDGYTLVETLVAIAILLGVLMPASVFFTKTASNRMARDLALAAAWARGEMETTVARGLYHDEEKTVQDGKKVWRIHRKIEKESGLIEIRVLVFRGKEIRPLVAFQTMRIQK